MSGPVAQLSLRFRFGAQVQLPSDHFSLGQTQVTTSKNSEVIESALFRKMGADFV